MKFYRVFVQISIAWFISLKETYQFFHFTKGLLTHDETFGGYFFSLQLTNEEIVIIWCLWLLHYLLKCYDTYVVLQNCVIFRHFLSTISNDCFICKYMIKVFPLCVDVPDSTRLTSFCFDISLLPDNVLQPCSIFDAINMFPKNFTMVGKTCTYH